MKSCPRSRARSLTSPTLPSIIPNCNRVLVSETSPANHSVKVTVPRVKKVFSRLASLGWLMLVLCVLSACGKGEGKKAAATGETTEVDSGVAEAGSTEKSSRSPNLTLHLKVGDKFPLTKTITTTVVQPGENGEERSTAWKEFLLTVTVEAMPDEGPRAGQKQMGVQFHSVKFERELQGQKLEYDSRTAKEPLPLVVRPYQGLVGNNFSFWLGAENQIEGIIDFDKFVERCLRNVPKERYEEVWNNLATQSGADGIANFVDDSIGLLPTTKVKTGENWTVTRRTQQPVPMVCKNRYTLQHLDDKQAEVSILGDILPAAFSVDAVPLAAQNGVQLSIKGGKASGSCTIDLRTGLPIHSQVEQKVEMLVKLKNGQEFTQHKQTITTIRAFPNSSQVLDGEEVTARQKQRDQLRLRKDRNEGAAPAARTAMPGIRNPRR